RPTRMPWHQKNHGSIKVPAPTQFFRVHNRDLIPTWGVGVNALPFHRFFLPQKILNSMLYCYKGGMLAWSTCFLTALMKCGTRPAAMVRTIFATIRPNGTIFLRCRS